ncbi:MAG: metallophosphoesterase [Anaerolineae bacterium]|nr:metallophosphoesterase [Anaerolineae bacterium]
MSAIFAIGDIHGHFEHCAALLRDAGLIDDAYHWTGADAVIVFMGDYVDRGPDGIAVIDLVMRLQTQAAQTGGYVIALLGNHDLLLALAYSFGRGIFYDWWRSVGGVKADFAHMTDEHLHWLLDRPLMVRLGDYLFIHADAGFYPDYGYTAAAVNHAIAQLMTSNDVERLADLVDQFGEHRAFFANDELAARFLAIYGGKQIVHGHTPIPKMAGSGQGLTTRPYIYARDLCINLDGGIYAGGAGFVYRVS